MLAATRCCALCFISVWWLHPISSHPPSHAPLEQDEAVAAGLLVPVRQRAAGPQAAPAPRAVAQHVLQQQHILLHARVGLSMMRGGWYLVFTLWLPRSAGFLIAGPHVTSLAQPHALSLSLCANWSTSSCRNDWIHSDEGDRVSGNRPLLAAPYY